jgi:2-dehydro-3-deoxygluconokinase
MLRLDPGEGRIRCARDFKVWEGGGEYNVARGLRRCFGLRTAICTAFADNDIGRLLEDFILQGGVDTRFIQWRKFDGVGRQVRNGLNFTERGFGVRGAVGIPDRGHTAASQLKPGDFDWEDIFGRQGVRWFHTGGIFAALSDTTPQLVIEAVQAARKHGTVVSYDLNYRPSLWKSVGGQARAQEVNKEIAKYVDVMLGNEEDFTACLGFEVAGADENLLQLDIGAFKQMIKTAVQAYPNFRVVATTLRAARTATRNDWGAVCWTDGQFYESRPYPDLEIFDRVGGGDSFASGLIFGLLTTGNPKTAVDYGAAHGALAMTTPGDTSMATRSEVEKLMENSGARVQR